MTRESIFTIIGPTMVGPSSSHTAGAVRLGRIARTILGETPQKVRILLHGSFAQTYRGHGTDRALVAGLMGYDIDSFEIKDALALARKRGMVVEFHPVDLGGDVHPNTAKIHMEAGDGKKIEVVGASTGGGNIMVTAINGLATNLDGTAPTLLTIHADRPGIIAKVSAYLAQYGINIGAMRVTRREEAESALMLIQTDQAIPVAVVNQVRQLPEMEWVVKIDPIYRKEGGTTGD